MKEQDCEQLTLFQEDSLVSPFPWLESKKVKKTIVTCGRRCSELSENLSRVGLSVRMYLESCELPLTTLQRAWSVKDLTSQCLILKLRLSALRIEEKELHSLQTGNPGLWKTPVAADAANREFYRNSRGEANLSGEVKLWPTPKASDSKGTGQAGSKSAEHDAKKKNLRGVVMYATPQARDFRTGQLSRWEDPQRTRNLNDQIGGQLNPTWVEWLMGFPIGWTDLNASETP